MDFEMSDTEQLASADIDYDRLAKAIAARMPPVIPISVDAWSATEIAAYLKRTRRTVAEKTVYLPGFPRPIRLPSTSKKEAAHPLWKARDVIAWAEKFQRAA